MSRSAKKPAQIQVTDWFRANTYHPALPGYYEVRTSEPTHYKHKLTGHRYRYWDGARWLTEQGGVPSVLGRHWTHQWRGRRMWVLASDHTMLSALNRKPTRAFLTKCYPRSSHWGDAQSALAFETKEKAERYMWRVHVKRLVESYKLLAVQP